MAERRLIAVVATLDTKGDEAAFVREWLIRHGFEVRLVDVGLIGAPQCEVREHDVSAGRAAAAAGASLHDVRGLRRDQGMAAMGRGAAAILQGWAASGTLAGAIGLGGNQGTAIACTALRSLPLGLPKVMVSTIASGDLRPYVGSSDIAVVFSLADLLGGPNRITRGVLERAAGMLAGMIAAAAPGQAATSAHDSRPAVALTALGNTHEAATRIMAHLRGHGFDVVAFHASGAGGSTMERLIHDGEFAGVVDLTTHEVLGEVWGDDIYAPVDAPRLVAAGLAGLPQVAAPGGLDYFVFGPPESVPPRYCGRPIHHHNPYNVNVRATGEELARVGQVLAERLNAARGPVAFLYPLRGWSQIGREGGIMWDSEANEALRRSLRAALRFDHVRYREIDANINDPLFADEIARVFLELAAAGLTRMP